MKKTTKLIPATLKSYRDARNMTQQVLAYKVGCSKDTLSRWERGKFDAMRPRLKDRLCEALGVEWEMLCRPYEAATPPSETDDTKPRSLDSHSQAPSGRERQLNVRIPTDTHNAFTTVSLRYGVALSDIVGLAPLLFLIVAERSLTKRRKRMNKLYALNEQVQKELPQFRFDLWPRSANREEDSIDRREVFGWEHWDNWQGQGLDPFVKCLKGLMTGHLEPDMVHLFDGQGGSPGYDLDGLTKELLDLELNPDDDELFWRSLRWGEIDLREIHAKKTSLPPEAFQEWLSAELARVRPEPLDLDF